MRKAKYIKIITKFVINDSTRIVYIVFDENMNRIDSFTKVFKGNSLDDYDIKLKTSEYVKNKFNVPDIKVIK